MKKKMRKFLLTLSAALLLVSMTVGVTVAYLTDSEVVTNTFTVGKVDIKLDEENVDGKDAEGNDNKDVARDQANKYKLLPGQPYKKDPMVTVLKGSEKSYVRVFVTISEAAALDTIFAAHQTDEDFADAFALTTIFGGLNTNVWVPVNAENPTRKDDTITYELRYNGIVPAVAEDAEKDLELAKVFTTVNVPGKITQAELNTITGMTIEVVAQAIQADGFVDKNADGTAADEAWDAFVAPVE